MILLVGLLERTVGTHFYPHKHIPKSGDFFYETSIFSLSCLFVRLSPFKSWCQFVSSLKASDLAFISTTCTHMFKNFLIILSGHLSLLCLDLTRERNTESYSLNFNKLQQQIYPIIWSIDVMSCQCLSNDFRIRYSFLYHI